MAKATKQLRSIKDLKPDPMNVNKGTERGAKVIDWSLTELGAGRSILADADGVVIAGNKTLQGAVNHGLPIRVVETTGDELVVVQRKDLRLTGSRILFAFPVSHSPQSAVKMMNGLNCKTAIICLT